MVIILALTAVLLDSGEPRTSLALGDTWVDLFGETTAAGDLAFFKPLVSVLLVELKNVTQLFKNRPYDLVVEKGEVETREKSVRKMQL